MNTTRPALLLLACAIAVSSWGVAGADGARTLVVGPGGYASIQAAVDDALPGDTVLVSVGTYQEAVVILTPGITLRGVDREGVVLEGGKVLGNGVSVNADNVAVESMTAQNYASNGFAFARVDGFRMWDLHAIDNGEYGLYAIHSTRGDISYSYAEGHGDSGFYIGETIHCDCDVHHNVGWNNMLGYSGTANSYVRIWANEFYHNRAGILMSVLPNEMGFDAEEQSLYGTQVRSEIHHNYIHDNNNHTRTSGIFEYVKPPVGEGITIAGGWMNDVHDNLLVNNKLWGLGMFWLTTPPRGNAFHDNHIEGSRYGVWWDEFGEDNCFEDNTVVDAQVASDPDPLPSCAGPIGDLPCPEEAYDLAACRASDARVPSLAKLAWLGHRSLHDLDPEEDL